MNGGEPGHAICDWGFAPARHEGYPADAARRLGMTPVVSVAGAHFSIRSEMSVTDVYGIPLESLPP